MRNQRWPRKWYLEVEMTFKNQGWFCSLDHGLSPETIGMEKFHTGKKLAKICYFLPEASNGFKTSVFGSGDPANPRWGPTSRAQGPTHPAPRPTLDFLSPPGHRIPRKTAPLQTCTDTLAHRKSTDEGPYESWAKTGAKIRRFAAQHWPAENAWCQKM